MSDMIFESELIDVGYNNEFNQIPDKAWQVMGFNWNMISMYQTVFFWSHGCP